MKSNTFQKYFNLSGEGAVFTGGAKGIGKAIAAGFLEAGANIVIADRVRNSKMPIKELRKIFGNNRIWGYQTDVTERNQVEGLKKFSIACW